MLLKVHIYKDFCLNHVSKSITTKGKEKENLYERLLLDHKENFIFLSGEEAAAAQKKVNAVCCNEKFSMRNTKKG